ncbi:formate/nitrite transporter family protein [Paraconexibacter sp.]|uniref:formate/nitrite transporter family protein n=1 Tax=Paraconexibacter sp. TaxID=2949640 RepID=UPI00356A4EC0
MDDATEKRPQAQDIYDRVVTAAADELERPWSALAISAVFAGLTIGIGPLGVASIESLIGHSDADHAIAVLAYPIGFIAVILGRAQLFTENTLYPVVLSLEDRSKLRPTAKLWAIVLTANLVGAVLFALLATQSAAPDPEIAERLRALGEEATAGGFAMNFWSAVIAGWLIALVAWLVEASDATIGRVAVIFALTYVVGVGSFDHIIASAGEALAALFHGQIDAGRFFEWLAAVGLGNAAGGVLIVSLLNYGQVRSGKDEAR